ncbi:MAG TPA: efflux RND transporter periplasmic adaptor subunit [Vicinamibacterales bacterium]|jgi:membrane fusion protein (multidrug efflux system)|nr:efflux RND transporter periplasmic adaptor subunit [Vicinamibacterales bacterium]
MNRTLTSHFFFAAALFAGAVASGCSTSADGKTNDQAAAPAAISVSAVAAVERPIARFTRATGTLMAEEQSEVAAEIAGRVVATPVERGTRVAAGAELIRLSDTETDAQAKEAEANAAQIEARLGIAAAPFDVNAVPEVQSAKASYELTQSEFDRIQSLLAQRVVSQSEFDQRRTQMEAARQQYESAKNGAAQQYQSLLAARARVTLARKAHTDTVVRAPFDGIVAQRVVSVGNYVNKGTTVAVVVRVDPMRVQLTIPEQFVSTIGVGQTVAFAVDAYPGRSFEGRVRYISPALEANQRALTVEAVVANPSAELKPGLFATARIQQAARTPAILVPSAAVQTTAGTSRVYVVTGDRVEERIVTIGQTIDDDMVEVVNGLKAGERIATTHIAQLADGTKVS